MEALFQSLADQIATRAVQGFLHPELNRDVNNILAVYRMYGAGIMREQEYQDDET